EKEEVVLGSLPLLSFKIGPIQPSDNISRRFAFKVSECWGFQAGHRFEDVYREGKVSLTSALSLHHSPPLSSSAVFRCRSIWHRLAQRSDAACRRGAERGEGISAGTCSEEMNSLFHPVDIVNVFPY
ncbi:pleckstrin homology domain-containing family A member 6 isoform X1, partial [Tachysurus ichikawai]